MRVNPNRVDRRGGVRANVRGALSLLLALLAAAVFLWVTGVGCPVRFVTGVACPGCGLTRAWLAAFRLDVHAALAYHPLFWAVPIAFALALLRGRIRSTRARRAVDVLLVVFVLAFLALWIVRLADPADAGLLFGGAAPAGVPTDVVYASKPAWFVLIEAALGR